MGKYLDFYLKDNGKEINKLVDKIVFKNFSGIPQLEYDDFYSIAAQIVWQCESTFDNTKGASFKTYLTGCLTKKIISRVSYLNRKKRHGDFATLSLEKIIGKDENCTLGNCLVAKEDDDISILTQRYLDSLTKKQRQVADLFMQGCNEKDVKAMLGLSNDRYKLILMGMCESKKLAPLKKLNQLGGM